MGHCPPLSQKKTEGMSIVGLDHIGSHMTGGGRTSNPRGTHIWLVVTGTTDFYDFPSIGNSNPK